MTRRSAKVVLVHHKAFPITGDSIAHIEFRRDAYATFSVWGKKYGEDPVTGPQRWVDRDRVKALKS